VATKSNLRQLYLAKRSALSKECCEQYSEAITQNLLQSPVYLSAKNIAVYLSFGNEVITAAIIDDAWQSEKDIYVPVIDKNKSMQFINYQPNTKTISNFYGLQEPLVTSESKIAQPEKLDLVLLPLLAFDKNGNRLGMGGGYYDRYLSFLNHALLRKTPKLMGLAYSCQEHEKLPMDTWDIALHSVTTEKQTQTFRQ
jgi:5-formyltetrahydrofolate cyclo-ligase